MGRPNTATKHHAPSRRPKPHEPGGPLDAIERDQAVEHSSLRAMVIHEVLREEGETELKREPAALAWSGLAAGLSMGFSFLGLALVHSALPEAPWTRLVDSIGYTVGFLITILGRQALFTESTGRTFTRCDGLPAGPVRKLQVSLGVTAVKAMQA